MNRKRPGLGELEEIVLLAIQRLPEAYGVTIRHAVEETAGRPTSYGAIYTTLDRLHTKGLVSSWLGDPTPERGGRAKRFYKLEGDGEAALRECEEKRERLRTAPSLRPVGETS